MVELRAHNTDDESFASALSESLCDNGGHIIDAHAFSHAITPDLVVDSTVSNYRPANMTLTGWAWVSSAAWFVTWIAGLYIPDKTTSAAAGIEVRVTSPAGGSEPVLTTSLQTPSTDSPISLSFSRRVTSPWKWLLTAICPPCLVPADDDAVRRQVLGHDASLVANELSQMLSAASTARLRPTPVVVITDAAYIAIDDDLFNITVLLASDRPLGAVTAELDGRAVLEKRDCLSTRDAVTPWIAVRSLLSPAVSTTYAIRGLFVPHRPAMLQLTMIPDIPVGASPVTRSVIIDDKRSQN